MALPKLGQAIFADEIYMSLPLVQKRCIMRQILTDIIGNAELRLKLIRPEACRLFRTGSVIAHARLAIGCFLTCINRVVRAAGVIPSSRDACPNVAGDAAANFCLTSIDSPTILA